VEVLTSRTIIHPSDLERSLSFYGTTLNLPVAREFGEGGGRGVVFFAGGGLIEIVGSREGGQSNSDGQLANAPVTLWLQVRSIQATVDELTQRGIEMIRPPTLEPWGLIEAWIADPDGLRIHLVEVPETHPLRRDQRNLAGEKL
jgi:predicted enzyme related to lactoylglutathione lyase